MTLEQPSGLHLIRVVRRRYVHPMKKCVYPLLLAILLGPMLVFLHECGHFMAASAFGAGPELHFGHVRMLVGTKTPLDAFCVRAAGPLVDVLFAVWGFLWLRQRHRTRSDAQTGLPDWIATTFVLVLTNFIVGFVATVTVGTVALDGAAMSLMLGWPGWLLPGVSALLALALIASALRLLPKGERLLPVMGIYLGTVLGATAYIVAIYLYSGYLPPE